MNDKKILRKMFFFYLFDNLHVSLIFMLPWVEIGVCAVFLFKGRNFEDNFSTLVAGSR